MKDEYFAAADSFDLLNSNCSELLSLKNQSFYEDLKARLHPLYNVTAEECEKLKNPICSSEDSLSDENSTCFSLEHLEVEYKNAADHDDLNESMMNCEKVSKSLSCVRRKLASTDYEIIRFHAAAVNFTVIEFQVWKYFSIAPQVKLLTEEAEKIENEALGSCSNILNF